MLTCSTWSKFCLFCLFQAYFLLLLILLCVPQGWFHRFPFSLFDSILYGEMKKKEETEKKNWSEQTCCLFLQLNVLLEIQAAKVHDVQAHGTDKTNFITTTATIIITISVPNRRKSDVHVYAFLCSSNKVLLCASCKRKVRNIHNHIYFT